MQRDPRNEERPAESREDLTPRKRRFQIVKLEERIAPGAVGRPDSVFTGHHCPHTTAVYPGVAYNPACRNQPRMS